MQLGIEITPDSMRRMEGWTRKALSRVGPAILKGAREAGVELQRAVVQEVTGQALDVRSGTLRRAIEARVEKGTQSGEPGITIRVGVLKGPATAYASIQEEGGTIKAKPGKALAIPISNRVKTPAGVGKWPRDLPATIRDKMFLAKPAGKDAVLMMRSKRGRPELLYALKREVTIPPHYWLSGPMQKEAPEVVPRRIGDSLAALLEAMS